MKILLIAINARYTHSCLAIYSLKSILRDMDVEIRVREFSINQKIEDIVAHIAAEKAEVIALSVYIWNSGLVRKLLPALNSQSGALIVLGGPEVSYNPGSWLQAFPFVDYIVTGHGEKGFRRLVEKGFKSREKIISIPNAPFKEMPAPYTEEDLAGLQNRYVYYESGRGCPFRCSYCLSSRSDQKMELKGIEAVKAELDFILRSRPRLVKFVDRTFNAAPDHSRDIWRHLLDNYASGPTTFHFEIHPLYLADEDFRILSRCPQDMFQFEVGIQSTNPESLAAVKRSGDWIREKASLERLISLGTIRIHLDLIAGLPCEDMTSIVRSFNEAYGLGPDMLQLGFLKVLPGTEMMESAGRYGMTYSETAPYQVSETGWLGKEELLILEKIAHLVDRLYNTRRFVTTLTHLAGRHESSFEMYRDLAIFPGGFAAPLTRSWDSCARFIMAYVDSRFSEEKSFFLDALRWDWCAVSRSLYYPGLIRPENILTMRKKGLSFFRGLAEKNAVTYKGNRFMLTDLKKSLFFEPESDEFRMSHMAGKTSAVFLPDKRIIMTD